MKRSEGVAVMEVASGCHEKMTTMEKSEDSDSSKRRRIDDSGELVNSSSSHDQTEDQNQNQNKNSTSVMNSASNSATSEVSDNVSSPRLKNESSTRLESVDLKAERLESEISVLSNGGFSRKKSPSSFLCKSTEEMESSTTQKKHSPTSKSSQGKMPSAEDLEKFFTEAEKYEQKRFAEKYNFDIVNDTPLKGRYQWVQLKP